MQKISCDMTLPMPAAGCRLCPTYATDINSPLRHVRTRIYFTSESHVHSLINVLRFCHTGAAVAAPPCRHPNSQPLTRAAASPPLPTGTWQSRSSGCLHRLPHRCCPGATPRHGAATGSRAHVRRYLAGKGADGEETSKGLVSEPNQARLRETPELDYLTHIVMRLYENKQCLCRPPSRPRSAQSCSPTHPLCGRDPHLPTATAPPPQPPSPHLRRAPGKGFEHRLPSAFCYNACRQEGIENGWQGSAPSRRWARWRGAGCRWKALSGSWWRCCSPRAPTTSPSPPRRCTPTCSPSSSATPCTRAPPASTLPVAPPSTLPHPVSRHRHCPSSTHFLSPVPSPSALHLSGLRRTPDNPFDPLSSRS